VFTYLANKHCWFDLTSWFTLATIRKRFYQLRLYFAQNSRMFIFKKFSPKFLSFNLQFLPRGATWPWLRSTERELDQEQASMKVDTVKIGIKGERNIESGVLPRLERTSCSEQMIFLPSGLDRVRGQLMRKKVLARRQNAPLKKVRWS